MSLLITGCVVVETSITISFSAAVDPNNTPGSTGALNPENYEVYDPEIPGFATFTSPDSTWGIEFSDPGTQDSVVLTLPQGVSFNPGDSVLVSITNIALGSAPGVPALDEDPARFSRVVPGDDSSNIARTTKNVEDAVSYPVLTEEIGYRPSPVGIPTGGGGGMAGGGGGGNIGQMALKAVTDVLGWKANSADPKGFVGALTQSFKLTEVEGHVQSSWTPRTYAVQTDLGGGITGAQASLYRRAKDALDQSLSLLDGLYPLDPEADPEYVKALREMARSQMTEIVREFGVVGLPSILRINTYFDILLGQHDPTVEFDPDEITGTLGELRNNYGIYFVGNPFNNSVEDEQDITNFRVISDYMTSLLQSWIANRDFFRLGTLNPTFFGTQLVLISRQFNVIAETVNEVRFTLDSVFIGPNERQALLLEFENAAQFPPMFLEDVLDEVEKFASEEGPRLLRDAGKISVTNNLLPVIDTLAGLINQAHEPANEAAIPDGYRTSRVQKSLDDLEDQLNQLITLIVQVEQQVPPAEDKLSVSGITLPAQDVGGGWTFSVFGAGFDPGTTVFVNSPAAVAASVEFFSEQRIDATVDPASWATLSDGSHGLTVTNSEGETMVLRNLFTIDSSGGVTLGLRRTPLPPKVAPAKAALARGPRSTAVKGRAAAPGAGRATAGAAKAMPVKGGPVKPSGPKPAAGAPAGSRPAAATPPVSAGAAFVLTDDEKKELKKHPLWDKIKHLF
jgi:hypothetical protein